MTNEFLFFLTIAIDLGLILIATKLGKEWLVTMIIANIVVSQISAAKIITLFGFTASASAVFYASIFLATDILTEHWGQKEGYSSVRKAFLVILFILGFTTLIRFVAPFQPSEAAKAFDVLFGFLPRIAGAGLIAYLVAQNFDIWLFHWIKERTKDRYLWLRNNGSTFVSQFVDSVLFFGLAFYGVVPNVWALILTGYAAKLIVAFFDTPFLYLSYKILNKPFPARWRESVGERMHS